MVDNGIESYLQKIALQEYLTQMNYQDRQVIILYYWWGYRDAEIGKMLGISQQLVNYKRKKAKSWLKKQITCENRNHWKTS